MADKVRLGFVGTGMMGQLAHLANYADRPDVELVAVAEGRTELASRVAARYGIREVCADHQALAARDDVDAVVAICGFGLNYGIVRDLLAAGKHVATEKSLCVRRTAARELVAAEAATGLVYQVSYMKRFDPGVEAARAQVAAWRASGEAGELRLARIWCSHGDWTWGIEPPLRSDEPIPAYPSVPEPLEPGEDPDTLKWVVAWLNYYSHQTNLIRHVLGEDYSVAYHDSWSGGDVIVAQAPSGCRVLLEMHVFRDAGWDEGFEVVFHDGSVRCQLPSPLARQQSAKVEIRHQAGQPRVERPYLPPRWAMKAQADSFIQAVRGGERRSPASEAAKEIDLAWELAATR